MSALFLLIVLIAVNAFFAASEMALVTINDNKLKILADEGHRQARKVLNVLNQPTQFLSTIQIGVTISGFLASAFAADRFSTPVANYLSEFLPFTNVVLQLPVLVFITLVLAYFTLVFGELVPKRLAMNSADKVVFSVIDVIVFISWLFGPTVHLLSMSTNAVVRLFGIDPNQEPEHVTEEEIRMLVDVGEEKGTIRVSEKEMINNIFEFDNKTVAEIMTHRLEIVGIPVDIKFSELKKLIIHEQYTRYPIYDDSLDNIVGIVHLKDILRFYENNRSKDFNLQNIMRKPYYIPESKHLNELLVELQKNKTHMAVVIDEYGGTAGIITIEDLIEEIVGEIDDEYDEDEKLVVRIGPNSFDVMGNIELEELEDELELGLALEEYDTLSGFLISLLGRIPQNHEVIDLEHQDIKFKILKVQDKRITKVRIIRPLTRKEDT
jgi:putative hemolysin